MSTVKDILADKGPQIWTVSPDITVQEAAALMNEHKIGCVIVGQGRSIAGIFTERDVLTRIVAARRDPAITPVREVMTAEVVCCTLDTPIDQARAICKNRRLRHLPVIDAAGRLQGLISIGDLNAWEAGAQELQIHYLHQYIHGRG